MRISDWSSDVCSSDLSDPMIKIRSGRHEASLPLSLVRRIVEEAEPRAFYNDVQVVRMDAGHLFKILQQMDVDAMSKQTRRAMVEAIDVSTAACALTFAGDIIIEADEETIFLANQKGASVQYRSEEHTSELQSLMRISYADF